jgi:hypothetical protein
MANSIGVASSSSSDSGESKSHCKPCDLTYSPPSPPSILSHIIERWQASITSPPQSDSSPKTPTHSRAHSESLDGKASVETQVEDCQGKERSQSEHPSIISVTPNFSLLQISEQSLLNVSCPLPLLHRADSYLEAFQGRFYATLSEHVRHHA